MMRRLWLTGFLSILLVWNFSGCSRESKPTPKEIEQNEVMNELPAQEENRTPDGGFGTLDYSRDTKKEAEDQQKASQEALQQTQ